MCEAQPLNAFAGHPSRFRQPIEFLLLVIEMRTSSLRIARGILLNKKRSLGNIQFKQCMLRDPDRHLVELVIFCNTVS